MPGTGTRPTSDRVREAIFSALQSRDAVRGARVVDLYAGSGALGLEAASRGAASVTLVERGSAAVKACHDNTARVLRNAPKSAQPTISVAAQAVVTFLGGSTATWDLALIDPPYEVGNDELAQTLAALAPRLSPGAIVVVERATRSAEPAWPTGITLDRSRSYGDTALWWASVSG